MDCHSVADAYVRGKNLTHLLKISTALQLAGWLLALCEEIFSLLVLCLLNFVAITFRE